MPIQRTFLDWRQPALKQAAGVLCERRQRDGEWDLGRTIVVVPGSRAGRRLLEILISLADERQLILTPPEIVTPDRFPELLYQARHPFAGALAQRLAWVAALQHTPAKTVAAFLPHPPAGDDAARWLAIGETLRKLHLELAADGLNCSQVLARAAAVEGFAEQERWKALCKLQELYHDTLDHLPRVLWDKQSARLVAIEQREIATDCEVVLVGMVDLNRAQRQMLDQIADQVTALVFAPPELADRFDEHGCVVPEKWTEAVLPLDDDQVERVDGPADQAAAVTRWLASLAGQYRADEIVIGLPDPNLAPQIERQLAQCGACGRSAVGQKLSQTGPYRLLKCAAEYAVSRRFRDLAALARHPDVYEWLVSQLPATIGGKSAGLLDVLDEFAASRFPARLDRERLEKDDDAADLLAIEEVVEQLVGPLDAESRPLGSWAEPLRQVLAMIYGSRTLDREAPQQRYLLKSLEALSSALNGLADLPGELDWPVNARLACRLVLDELASESIPPPADAEAIELLGWLDLALDDAPATLVTTFNEGWIPSASTADALLPNRLRESLGLMHNDRRLARDAYAASVLCASRRELRFVAAHRDSQGNPLAPSRLLFLAEPEIVARRAVQFFGDLPAALPRRSLLAPAAGVQPRSQLSPPRPQPLAEPPSELSVTQFRDFIACPYRFYLGHVLKLQPAGDDVAELDGAAFGSLVHSVLEKFGRAEDAKDLRTSGDEQKIAGYLDDQLDRIAAARFGAKQARPAVRVQVEQLRLRLRAFARWQAARSRDGWRIVFSEDAENQRNLTAAFTVDGMKFTLRGRIDRIDFHESLGRLAVLDYKTADSGLPPTKTHRRGEEWIDLQLPLYRHLVAELQRAGNLPACSGLELGYVVLPLDVTATGLALADWDDALRQSADEMAMHIIRSIREQQFWPPTSPPPDFAEVFAAICQDNRMGGGGALDGPEHQTSSQPQ
jgi:RecB family exonuclease